MANNEAEAIKLSEKTSFYKNYGFKGAVSNINNKYGLDVDEIYPIEELLTQSNINNFSIIVSNEVVNQFDEIHLGYAPLAKLGIPSETKS